MASAPGDRPRRLGVVRRLIGRLRILRRPAPGETATAGVVGGLAVRRPWSLVQWWHRMRPASAMSASATAASSAVRTARSATTGPTTGPTTGSTAGIAARRPIGARPAPLVSRRPALTGTARVALTAPPAAGPQVRPGHDLRMRKPPSLLGTPGPDLTTPVSTPAPHRATPPLPGPQPLPGPPVLPPAPGAFAASRKPLTGAGGGLVAASAPLAVRPVAGPAVSNPESAADMRVLGAASLPPGDLPDPSGAVSVAPPRPAAAPRPGPGIPAGRHGGTVGVPVPSESPRSRWQAAVAARPLEAPRPLPAHLRSMAAAISGRTRPPMFTTGPATRAALSAAGALGATTGTVVHLPETPRGPTVSGVLAHELTHTRNPVTRPRFFLGGASALLDDDERAALAAGARQAASNAASGLMDQGRDAMSGLIGRGRDAATGLIGQGQGMLAQGRQMADGLVAQGRQALGDAGTTAAGIVDQLPVGGGLGAVGDVATRAARAAVMEAAASPPGMITNAESAIGQGIGGLQQAAGGVLDDASGYVDQAASAATGAVDQATGAVSNAAGGVAGGAAAAAKQVLDPDRVVEIVEQRLLREIERRGGRWAGMF